MLQSPPVAEPLTEDGVARYADGSIVLVLAREEVVHRVRGKPVFIRGIGWAQHTPNLEEREWQRAVYAEQAGHMAYDMAGIKDPVQEIDLAEVDDTFAYKELQHLEALGLARPGEAGKRLEEGMFHADGNLPVNVSGGNLGCGYTYDLSGLRSVLEVVLQLRGAAGERQLDGVQTGLAQSWRGIPTASGGVVVLGNE